ncbi:hypothetical protein [Mucilaginibacter glaciei]|uniref:Uncharacterized protein n=1 Tax=Mucilaginibacter glaciei TaxID=2772109 RepID=A0A926NUN1_9SPHI|nr:hypothetical protein [Mucilaginibacter glaciei]MBD1394335.1 hypothetical protein [Mucilaginibacter glaciei]
MKYLVLLLVYIATAISTASGQQFNKAINKDSLAQAIVKDLPKNKKEEFLTHYKSGNEQTKEFLLMMFSMPRSSKKQLIENIKSNYHSIDLLKTEYAKLTPKGFIIFVEFKPADKLVTTPESIDLDIQSKANKVSMQDWNLTYNSTKLNEMLKLVGWDYETLKKIKKLLIDAHCISIGNRAVTEIGFARSGLGKYSYLIFNKDLTSTQIKEYNNGCSNIFFGGNIVLEYGGGAVGPQCFPDR